MTKIAILTFLALVSAPLAAQAGDGCGGDALLKVQNIFDRADADEDGLLTKTEYEEAGLQHYGVSFEQSDLNEDGSTSLDEYIELYEAHHLTVDRREA